MTEYTPTTDEVRRGYVTRLRQVFVGGTAEHEAEFDRWLAQVKADALREVAHELARECEFDVYPTCPKCIAQSHLLLRAKEIEGVDDEPDREGNL